MPLRNPTYHRRRQIRLQLDEARRNLRAERERATAQLCDQLQDTLDAVAANVRPAGFPDLFTRRGAR